MEQRENQRIYPNEFQFYAWLNEVKPSKIETFHRKVEMFQL